jgi:hypothetical protein
LSYIPAYAVLIGLAGQGEKGSLVSTKEVRAGGQGATQRAAVKKPARPRPTKITIDLLEYRKPWEEWCKARKVKPAEAFRQIVAKLAAQPLTDSPGEVEEGAPERPEIAKRIVLTKSEAEKVEALAAADGLSVPRWLVAVVRSRLTRTPQFGQDEMEAIARSNAALLAIGRNLNQIAKALNTNVLDRAAYRVELVEEVADEIKAHTKLMAQLMTANIERWRIK